MTDAVATAPATTPTPTPTSDQKIVDEQKALEAEKAELAKLEQQIKTDEEKLQVKKKRDELGEREKKLREVQAIEAERAKHDLEERKGELEKRKEHEKEKKQLDEFKKQAEEEEKEFISTLCSVLPEGELEQLSWALFKIEPGKGDSHMATIPLSPDLNIYDAVREQCPEGGQFRLKLQKGNVFASKQALLRMVKGDESRSMIEKIPLSFKISLHEKEDDYPKSGYGRFSPEWSGRRPYGGFGQPPPDAYPNWRSRFYGGKDPEDERRREEKERSERDAQARREERQAEAVEKERERGAEKEKTLLDAVFKGNEARLSSATESMKTQIETVKQLLHDGKPKEADAALKILQESHGKQLDLMKDMLGGQVATLKDEIKRLHDQPKAADNGIQIANILKETQTVSAQAAKEAATAQAQAAKEAAIAQAEAMKTATSAQAEAMKSAMSGQAAVNQQIVTMQLDAMKSAAQSQADLMKSTVERMMGDFKEVIANMGKERERDRDFTKSMMDVWREQNKQQLDSIKEQSKQQIDTLKEQAKQEKGQPFDKMMQPLMNLSAAVMAQSVKSVESQITLADRFGKMLKKLKEDDEEDEEENKTGLDKVMEMMQPPVMKMLEIALEQVKQGKTPEQVKQELPQIMQEQIRQNPSMAGASSTVPPVREAGKEPPPKSLVEELLAEHRDDVIPLIVSAIEKNADEDWLVTMILSDTFDAAARTHLALTDAKKVQELLFRLATDEEKKVLGSPAALPYLARVQARLNVMQQEIKKLAEAEMKAMGAGRPPAG